MGKSDFEQNILNKLKSQKDKDYVLKIYSYSTDDNSYHRIAIKGSAKRKLEHIIGKSGYKPENNKVVGLYNYKKIFTGKIDKDFYPYIERIEKLRDSFKPISSGAFKIKKFSEKELILRKPYGKD